MFFEPAQNIPKTFTLNENHDAKYISWLIKYMKCTEIYEHCQF